ncbi:MAG: cytochrome c biogenesis protein CcdA [Pseudomonadota bacterium]
MDLAVGYGAAALAGLASFLTPCILPIVPFFLCYISGFTFEELTAAEENGLPPRHRRVVWAALAFSLGMIIVFVTLGVAATALGQQVRAYSEELRWIAAAIILLLGLHYLGFLRLGILMREARIDLGDSPVSLFAPLLIGMAFAFGWTPCVGPILAVILFKAADSGSVMEGGLLLFAYGIGMTAPFVLAATFIGPFLIWAKRLRRHLGKIEKAIGAVLVVFAILIGTNSVNQIASWMLKIAPDWGLLL